MAHQLSFSSLPRESTHLSQHGFPQSSSKYPQLPQLPSLSHLVGHMDNISSSRAFKAVDFSCNSHNSILSLNLCLSSMVSASSRDPTSCTYFVTMPRCALWRALKRSKASNIVFFSNSYPNSGPMLGTMSPCAIIRRL